MSNPFSNNPFGSSGSGGGGGGGGSGDVVGPASATDEALVRFNTTTGKAIQNSVITATDAGIVAGVTQLNVDNLRLDGNTLSSTDTNGNIALAPNGTGVVTVAQLQATGSAGLDLHNSGGTPIILIGAGGGVNASINAPANVGSNLADYHQIAGGSGVITDTAAGSSTNISINLVPKGTGRLQVGGVDVPTVSSTDTLTNKTLTSPTLTTPTISGAITFPDDVRQTFNPGTTNAGLNVGSIAGDPSSPSNGDLWYDSTANELTARINGASVALGAGGGGGAKNWEFISTTTASNQTLLEIDLTGSYRNYMVEFVDVVPVSNGYILQMRTSSDGGSTFDSGTDNYSWAYSGYGFYYPNRSMDTKINLTYLTKNVAGSGANGFLTVLAPAAARHVVFMSNMTETVFNSDLMGGLIGTSKRLTTSGVNALQFFFSTGNISSGSFRLYGTND